MTRELTAIRSVVALSLGTFTTRALAALSQLVLAIWLAPAQFGYWATAISIVSLAGGLANFGEVNGFLSGQGRDFVTTRSVTRRLNCYLAVAGLGISVFYVVPHRYEVAALAVVASLTIPFQGESDLLYAAGVRRHASGTVVRSQVLGACVKALSGVLIAMLTASAMSIAVSTWLFYVAMNWSLRRVDGSVAGQATAAPDFPRAVRVKWAVNSLMMTIPLQIGYIVVAIVSTPTVLGLYFFAYSVTTALSGMIAAPLARTALSTMAEMSPPARYAFALRLASAFAALFSVGACALTLVLPLVAGSLKEEWRLAVPVICILLASLSARMATPILDALQQSEDRWWQSTMFNVMDAVVTAAAALVALTQDVVWLAIAVTAAKILVSVVRMLYVLRHPAIRTSKLLVAVSLPCLTALAISAYASFGSGELWFLPVVAATLSGIWGQRLLSSVRAEPVVARSM